MVPIRDPKLIGRKIDCPKCKYRFVVEEPADEVEDLDDEGPDKKGKPEGITNKKPANGKAAKAPGKRRPDDDEDLEEKPKKKQAGSGMLIVGIALAAIAVIALAVGAVFLFTGDSDEDKPSSRSLASAPPPSGENTPTDNKQKTEPTGPKPRHEDITNLLPNDTQVVVNLPLEHLLSNAKVNQALLKTPGAFHEAAFQRIWGIPPTEVRRVVIAYNAEKQTVFSVMRTNTQLKEDKIVAGLKLQAEAPINGLKHYLIKKPLDALSTLLLKGGEYRPKVSMHFIDPFTVVCADVGPMTQFLQSKWKVNQLSSQPAQKEQGGGQGGPQGGGQQGMQGMQGGGMQGGNMQQMMQRRMQGGQGGPPAGMQGGGPPAGMQGGGPPAGMQGGGPPAGMQGGGPPAGMQGGGPPQGGGGKPPAGMMGGGPGGGFQPPSGMPSGMAPSSMTGGGNAAGAAPESSSYMTIDPHLKAVLDQAERVDKNENQNVLLSVAMSTAALSVEYLKKSMAQQGGNIPQVPDFALKLFLDSFRNQLKAVGVAVTELSDSKIAGNVAVGAKDATLAQDWEKKLTESAPALLAMSRLDLVAKNPAPNNNVQGMQGGGMMGMQGGMMGMQGGGMQGGGVSPQQMQQEMMRRRMMMQQGGMQGGMPPGGPGGGFPGAMQPPEEGEKPDEKGKHGSYETWMKDSVLALGVNYNIPSNQSLGVGAGLEFAGIFLRGVMAMSDRASRIHELAAATQAFFEEKGHFPRGTVSPSRDSSRVLDWRPDQRFSWMRLLLPYLANGEYKEIKFEDKRPWNEDLMNMRAGLTVIPQFVAPVASDNPMYYYVAYPNLVVKGPSSSMWAATNFVGMAGVGLDAAEYRANDPATAKKRGVFGYDRETKKADIKDGLDQTIALIQVPTEPKSPWIAGGGSTVRGVSEDLDCVQPFVCTEYQGKRGTFAIMADGKVRFIPATIDPKTFQAMCTIAGDDKVKDLEKVAPEVSPPDDMPEQPELKAEPKAPAAPPPAVKPAQSENQSKLPAGWKEIDSKEGRYHVALPTGQVQDSSRNAKTPFGEGTLYEKMILLSDKSRLYAVQYMDVAGEIKDEDSFLDGFVREQLKNNPGSQEKNLRKITMSGRPGLEFEAQVPEKGNLFVRIYLDKNRLYSLISRGLPGKPRSDEIQAFFDSFQITTQ
jgi:hypothetical protein